MYRVDEFAEFAVEEFRRDLEGLTQNEALFRPGEADGTRMNAISWTVRHIADHWLNVACAARELLEENRRWCPHAIEAFGPHRCMFESNLPWTARRAPTRCCGTS